MADHKDDDLTWDDLCVDPHKAALEAGRIEGREAGLAAGFKDGHAIGALKGVEYGLELGFMNGALKVVIDALSTNPEAFGDDVHRERITKTTSALSKMLHTFPGPDQVFGDHNQQWLVRENNNNSNREDTSLFVPENGNEADNDSEQDFSATTSPESSGLLGLMQSIRSKFKLLTIQLRWTNFSLKRLMDEAASTVGQETPDSETQGAATIDTSKSRQDPSDW